MEPLQPDDPREIGPYRLEWRLGGGGMGQVFLGRSRGGRPVAVKVVRPELAGHAGFRRRFTLEAEAARRVGGFYTAQVVDADPDADPPWLVTAYIPGPSLHEAVGRHGPLPEPVIGVLGLGLAEGLAAIHGCDLVHRDLKPSNVILAEDGPRVIDFGIARALDATSHTTPRAMLGTPSFMSPEQARGDKVGPPSDVFSLASVLVFAATGRTPFGTGSPHALPYRIVHEEPDLSGVPTLLGELLTACFAKDPAARPAVADVLDRLAAPGLASTRWLPPDLTTLITERRAATRTSAVVPLGGTGRTLPDASGRPAEQATIEIGNLGRRDLDIIVDGRTVSRVAAGGHGSIHITPGSHTLQAEAGPHRSAAHNIDLGPGTTVRSAFSIYPGRMAPALVERAVFSPPSTERAVKMGVFAGLTTSLIVLAVASSRGWHSLTQGGLQVFIVMIGMLGGVLAFMAMTHQRSSRLILRSDGLAFDPAARGKREKTIGWDVLERISLIGDGRDARLVAWYREGHDPSNGEGVHGGTLVCEVKDLIAGERIAGLRAALKWFAPDLYTEQPS